VKGKIAPFFSAFFPFHPQFFKAKLASQVMATTVVGTEIFSKHV